MIWLVLLASFGVCWIVGFSKITLPLRRLLGGWETDTEKYEPLFPGAGWICNLIECPGCLGFHLGWIYELTLGPTGISGPRWFQVIVVGAAFAASNFILGRITRLID